MKLYGFVLLSIAILLVACNNATKTEESSASVKPGITKADWGTVDSSKVYLYTLTNSKGTVVTISNYGGTVTSFVVADKNGNRSSVIIGFDSLSGYLAHPPYFGALVGRYGNRIGDAKFTLDGKQYKLAAN